MYDTCLYPSILGMKNGVCNFIYIHKLCVSFNSFKMSEQFVVCYVSIIKVNSSPSVVFILLHVLKVRVSATISLFISSWTSCNPIPKYMVNI